MPIGKDHLILWKRYKNICVFFGVVLTAAVVYYTGDLQWSLLSSSVLGYLLGYYIDPDLDQPSMTAAEWRMVRDFKILGYIFIAWWMPYSIIKHRSVLSHSLAFSTAIRLAWLLLFPPLALLIYYFRGYALEYYQFFVGIFIGLAMADSIHILADKGIIRVRRGSRRR